MPVRALVVGLLVVTAVSASAARAADVASSIHVKDFFAPGRGVSLSIPERAKPGLYAVWR